MTLYLYAALGSLIPLLLYVVRDTKEGELPSDIKKIGFWIAQLARIAIGGIVCYLIISIQFSSTAINPKNYRIGQWIYGNRHYRKYNQ